MYVTATIDLTENGRVPAPDGMPQHVAEYATVRLYPPNRDRLDIPTDQALTEALAATRRCRLISKGHAHKIEFLPSVSGGVGLHHEFYLPESGRELARKEAGDG